MQERSREANTQAEETVRGGAQLNVDGVGMSQASWKDIGVRSLRDVTHR